MRKKFLLPLMVFCLLAFLSGSFVSAKAKEFSKSNATCIATYSEYESGHCTYIAVVLSSCTDPIDNCRVTASICQFNGVLSINIISTCEAV